MRATIRATIADVTPMDTKERVAQKNCLSWIDSGAELCRLVPPATPSQHLVSYFVLVDGDHLLLGDHRKANLWLPCGGHVDPGEHPLDTVYREAQEELGIEAETVYPHPVFLTVTHTRGPDRHIDVSLWYVVKGDRNAAYAFDRGEYRSLRWVPFDDLPPPSETDPELHRFAAKYSHLLQGA